MNGSDGKALTGGTGEQHCGPFVLGIDQSTQGTKVLLFDRAGAIVYRADRPHRQIINDKGWVSHDPDEIYTNLISAVREITETIPGSDASIAAVGISNQRETCAVWDDAGMPVLPAIVWQCGRAAAITEAIEAEDPDAAARVKAVTGLNLSPYFSAAKMAWYMQQPEIKAAADAGEGLHLGTMDSFLVYRLTGGKVFRTDAGNASRTQLMDLSSLTWSSEMLDLFGIHAATLPEISDSNSTAFGETDFEDLLQTPAPVLGVLGDSHAALFGHGCVLPGMAKTTYGTGSSIMMNTGDTLIRSRDLVSCTAWRIDGVPAYCLEGNINYTGAVITWLKDDVRLIDSVSELEPLVLTANPEDTTILVPAFTGLSAPYWDSNARASIVNMSRTTGRAEIAKAAQCSIAYQIRDVLAAMSRDAGMALTETRVDGGPTRNRTLMQFQSDIADCRLMVPDHEELSAMGAAYLAGITAGIYDAENIRSAASYTAYEPGMDAAERTELLGRWQEAVNGVLGR